ncbi:MAG: hypothetical protein HOB79_13400 [Rhodospirillaceae bacterium]|nr:hypothetical protein [Rhodospirillaceae bacterium]
MKCVHERKDQSVSFVKGAILAAALSLGAASTAFAGGGSGKSPSVDGAPDFFPESNTSTKGLRSLFPLGDRFEVIKLSTEKTPFQGVGENPARPKLAIELGDPFLDTGNLGAGFEIGTGAVWQPRLWAFMIYRTALQHFNNRATNNQSEWANRLDLFANLQLTGTEKLVFGIRPLDANRFGKFTRQTFDGRDEGFTTALNFDVTTFFFEGDFGSLFPNADIMGTKPIDWGFTIGRQVINFQEGIMINDTLDAVGVVRNNIISIPGVSGMRLSFLYAWDSLDRPLGDSGVDASLYGIFGSADTYNTTYNFDMAYAYEDNDGTGDQLNLGLAAIQRVGNWSTALRANLSIAPGDNSRGVADGLLLSTELSTTVPGSDDIFYLNPFVSFGQYSQLGREPISGGPLGSLGIMFASPNMGAYGAEISPFTDDNIGFATGYQAFWDHTRRNMILELAGRLNYNDHEDARNSVGIGVQLQQAIGSHFQVQAESFYAFRTGGTNNSGVRLELQVVY